MNYSEKGRQIPDNTVSPPVKYHGLLNQGATCYLNSVLQVLFMSKDFRETVERHTRENPNTECIDGHLTALFDDLKQYPAYTYKITKKLGIDKVNEERDAAEYFEKILSLSSPDASQIFHGQLTQKTICSTCSTETDTDGAFWHLPLALVDSHSEDYSVVDGIKDYFRVSDFSGENQIYCDQCDAKSDATTKCVIKHHPEVLMLLLKRIEFDYRYMTYVKINCGVVVPRTLQIPENQTYELYAVVDHFGDLRRGHYAATIKSQDDERWYTFHDERVTLLDYQPFQVDNFEKSHSVYLLFYRRNDVHVADTCAQDAMELSTPPATSDTSDHGEQCKDAAQLRERQEVEGEAEASNVTAVVVTIDRNEGSAVKDIASAGSRGVGLSPDPFSNVGDAHAEKQSENADTDDQAEKSENVSRETQLEESVEDADNNSGRQDDEGQMTADISHDVKPEASDRNAIHGHNKPDEMSDAQRKVLDIKTENNGTTGGYELLEKNERSSTEINRDAEYQDSEGLDDGRKNIKEDQGGTQEVRQENGHKPVSVDKQGGEERMERDVKVDEEGETRTDERGTASESEKLLTTSTSDLCNPLQDNEGNCDSEQTMSKDHQKCEQGNSSRYERCEQEREERSDVKGDMEQNRGDDKHAQIKGTSESQQHFGQDVEDENNGGLDDVRKNRPEHNTSDEHTINKDVGVEKHNETQEREGDNEHIRNRADSPVGQAGSAGSRRLTENRGVDSVEMTRQICTTEVTCGSKQSRQYRVKIVEEEYRTIKTVERASEQDTLVKGVYNLNLSESPLPELQKCGTKRVIGNAQEEDETNTTTHVFTKKMLKVSDTEEEAAAVEHGMEKRVRARERKRRWSVASAPKMQHRKLKKKQTNTI